MLRVLTDTELGVGMHFLLADGSLHSAGFAAVELLAHLPVPVSWLGALARRSPFFGGLVRSAYAVVAERRARLARFVPNASPPSRP